MKTIDLSLVIACYNEEKLLAKSIKEIEFVLENAKLSYEVILIDDKSKDNTRELIKRIAKKRKNFSFFFHKVNCGRGKTVSDGIKKAKGKVVGFIDIDLEVSPVYIPYFVAKILSGQADIGTGYRIYHESLSSLPRAVLSRGYSFLVRKFLEVKLNDTEAGYKFFNRQKILSVLKETKNPGWFWDTEIMALAYYDQLIIKEIPVLFIRRFDKKSAVNVIPDTVSYFVNLYRFRKRLKKDFRYPYE